MTERRRHEHTPVDAVPSSEVGLWRIISKIPSATFVKVPDQEKVEGETPEIGEVTGFVGVPHTTVEGSSTGCPPIPEDDILNFKLLVILVHDIGTLNSSTMSMVVAFVSPGVTWMRASCPGRNRVSIGGGETHSLWSTRALMPYVSMDTDSRHPWYGPVPFW